MRHKLCPIGSSCAQTVKSYVRTKKKLALMNKEKIAHLDIKPLNYLIRETSDSSFDVVLTDFGISQCYQACKLASKSKSNPNIAGLDDLMNAISLNELELEKGRVLVLQLSVSSIFQTLFYQKLKDYMVMGKALVICLLPK